MRGNCGAHLPCVSVAARALSIDNNNFEFVIEC